MTAEERRSASNGIWCCQTCAKLVDNDEARFTVSLLREWKEQAEAEALERIGKTDPSDSQVVESDPPYTVKNVNSLPWLSLSDADIAADAQISVLKQKGYTIGGGAVSNLGSYLRGGSEVVIWKQPGTNTLYRLFWGFEMEPGPVDLVWLMRKA